MLYFAFSVEENFIWVKESFGLAYIRSQTKLTASAISARQKTSSIDGVLGELISRNHEEINAFYGTPFGSTALNVSHL